MASAFCVEDFVILNGVKNIVWGQRNKIGGFCLQILRAEPSRMTKESRIWHIDPFDYAKAPLRVTLRVISTKRSAQRDLLEENNFSGIDFSTALEMTGERFLRALRLVEMTGWERSK